LRYHVISAEGNIEIRHVPKIHVRTRTIDTRLILKYLVFLLFKADDTKVHSRCCGESLARSFSPPSVRPERDPLRLRARKKTMKIAAHHASRDYPSAFSIAFRSRDWPSGAADPLRSYRLSVLSSESRLRTALFVHGRFYGRETVVFRHYDIAARAGRKSRATRELRDRVAFRPLVFWRGNRRFV